MVVKTVKFDEEMAEKVEIVIKKLNQETGVNVYDFSNVVRIAVNQYLNSTEIKELLKQDQDPLYASETSLEKDWLCEEENKAWENL